MKIYMSNHISLLISNIITKSLIYLNIILIILPVSLSALTLEEKVAKLIVIPISPNYGEKHIQDVHKLLRERGIGGVIFMAGTLEKQQEIVQALNPEVLVFQDAEWGTGMRLSDVEPLQKNFLLMEGFEEYGLEIARQCRVAGVQVNFAPVADVYGPFIGDRSFGTDPSEVVEKACSVARGMKKGGILACPKHFPGHGHTEVDSHLELPVLTKLELEPFMALIEEGVDLMMVGHLLYPPLSMEPSSLSYEICTELLREKLGFEGVIVTDSLVMKALSGSPESIAQKALLAGNDLLLYAGSPEILESIPSIIEHLAKTIPEELLDEKLKRVDTIHQKFHNPVYGKYETIPQFESMLF